MKRCPKEETIDQEIVCHPLFVQLPQKGQRENGYIS
jgi:hypothetical protein